MPVRRLLIPVAAIALLVAVFSDRIQSAAPTLVAAVSHGSNSPLFVKTVIGA